MKKTALAIAGLALLAIPTLGDRLDAKAIPTNARFVVHVDLTGLQKTEVWNAALGIAKEQGQDPLAELMGVEQELGINPLEDISSITLFSPDPEPEKGVAMIVGNEKIDAIFERVQQEEGYVSVEVEGLRLHVMDVENGETAYAYVEGTGDHRVVLVSANRKELVRGALVLRGEQPCMADMDEPSLSLKVDPGAFLFVSSVGNLPGIATGMEPASRLFDLAKSFTFNLGETDGELNGRLAVVTESEKTALEVNSVLQGAMALARMFGNEVNEELGGLPNELMDSLEFGTRGKTVNVRFSFDVKELLERLQELDLPL